MQRLIAALAALVIGGGSLWVPVAVAAGPNREVRPRAPALEAAEYVPGEVIVQFRPGAVPERRAATLASVQGQEVAAARSGARRVKLAPGQRVEGAVAELQKNSDVLYAEPNYVYRVAWEITDPAFTGGEQWGLTTVKAPQAWEAVPTGGGTETRVAVVDSGVDPDHPDLAGRLAEGGRNFVTGAPNPADFADDNGHGTHVAGIIAAAADGSGMVGVAGPANVRVLPVKVMSADGSGTSFDIAQGIHYAADRGAAVINLSLGGPYSRTEAEAVAYAQGKGALVVAAAGNEGGLVSRSYPAALPGVLAVAALTPDEGTAGFSNYGPEIDLAAPGVDILSTIPVAADTEDGTQDGYAAWPGTSMAAPFVAGAAALLKSLHPEYTAEELARVLTATARDDAGAGGFDEYYGYGILDMAAAVASAVYADSEVTVDLVGPSGTWRVAGPTDLVALVSDPDQVAAVDFFLSDPDADGSQPVATGAADRERPARFSARYDFRNTPPGRHTLYAVAWDAQGQELDRDSHEVEAVADPSSGLTVKVLDPEGNPVIGADLYVYHVDGGAYEWDDDMVVETGPEGLVRLPGSLAADGNDYFVVATGEFEVPAAGEREPFLMAGRVRAPGDLTLDGRQARHVQVRALGRPDGNDPAPPLAGSDLAVYLTGSGSVLVDDYGDPLAYGISALTGPRGEAGIWLSDGDYRFLVHSDAARHYLFRDVTVNAGTASVTVDTTGAVAVGIDRNMAGGGTDEPDVEAGAAFLNLYPVDPATSADWDLGPYFDVTEGPAVITPGTYEAYLDLDVDGSGYTWEYTFQPAGTQEDGTLAIGQDVTYAVRGPLSAAVEAQPEGPYTAGESTVDLDIRFTDANGNRLNRITYGNGMALSVDPGTSGPAALRAPARDGGSVSASEVRAATERAATKAATRSERREAAGARGGKGDARIQWMDGGVVSPTLSVREAPNPDANLVPYPDGTLGQGSDSNPDTIYFYHTSFWRHASMSIPAAFPVGMEQETQYSAHLVADLNLNLDDPANGQVPAPWGNSAWAAVPLTVQKGTPVSQPSAPRVQLFDPAGNNTPYAGGSAYVAAYRIEGGEAVRLGEFSDTTDDQSIVTCEACGELREADILVAGYGSSDGSAVMLWKRLTAAEAGGAAATPIPMGNDPDGVAHVTITVDGTIAGQPVHLDGPGDDDNLQLELVVDGVPVDTLVLTQLTPSPSGTFYFTPGTPGTYNFILSSDDTTDDRRYFLALHDVTITEQTETDGLTLNATAAVPLTVRYEPKGGADREDLDVWLRLAGSGALAHWFHLWSNDEGGSGVGEPVLISPGVPLEATFDLEYDAAIGRAYEEWDYELRYPGDLVLTGAREIQAGGGFRASIDLTAGVSSPFRPGDTVNFGISLTDARGNRLMETDAYWDPEDEGSVWSLPAPKAGETGARFVKPERRAHVASHWDNAPIFTVYDPSGRSVYQHKGDEHYDSAAYTIPQDAAPGTYTAEILLGVQSAPVRDTVTFPVGGAALPPAAPVLGALDPIYLGNLGSYTVRGTAPAGTAVRVTLTDGSTPARTAVAQTSVGDDGRFTVRFGRGSGITALADGDIQISAVAVSGSLQSDPATDSTAKDTRIPAFRFRLGGESVTGLVASEPMRTPSVAATVYGEVYSTSLVRVDGASFDFDPPVPLDAGGTAVAVRGRDNAGNEGRAVLFRQSVTPGQRLQLDSDALRLHWVADQGATVSVETQEPDTSQLESAPGDLVSGILDVDFGGDWDFAEDGRPLLEIPYSGDPSLLDRVYLYYWNPATGTWEFTGGTPSGDGDAVYLAVYLPHASQFAVIVDTTPPVLELTQPADGAVVPGATATIEVQGTTEPDAAVTVNGASVAVDRSTGRFSARVDLAVGNNHIEVVATDPAGNETRLTRTVTRQSQASGGSGGGGGGGGGSTKPQPSAPGEQQMSIGAAGGRFTAFGGEIIVEIPAGAVPDGTTLTIRQTDRPAAIRQPGLSAASSVFAFTFTGPDGSEVEPGRPVRVTIRYNPSAASDDPRRLAVYREQLDGSGNWVYVGGRIDPVTGAVQVDLNGFSRYAVLGYRPSFSDMTGHWAKADVELLASRWTVQGAGGLFRPDDPITRAELAKLLVTALRHDAARAGLLQARPPDKPTFADVPPAAWYYEYVEAAARAGLVTGSDGRFRPDDRITREEIAAMLVRALGLAGEAQSLGTGEVTTRTAAFGDAAAIPAWARPYVATAAYHGVMQGAGGQFGAGAPATRAEAAALIRRLAERFALFEAPVELTGSLEVSEVEGRHYELVAADGRYVLLAGAGDQALAAQLRALEGRTVRVTGVRHAGPTTYQRGPAVRVTAVRPG